MDDSPNKSICVEPIWKTKNVTREEYVQTDALNVREVAVERCEKKSLLVQTDNQQMYFDTYSRSPIRTIDKDIVEMMMDALQSSILNESLVNSLNVFHQTHHVCLSLIKQFQLQQIRNDESLIGMECGSRGRIAFLLGEIYHDSWCSHDSRMLIYRRESSSFIPLPGCPSAVRFGNQGLIAVATFTGQLIITTDNEIQFSTEAHQLAVTSLEWLSSTSIISASLDGTIVIHLLKSNLLEQQCSLTIRVSDLPRKIRNSNAASRPTGITSLCVINDTVFVAGETGAIWSVSLPDLTRLMTIACEMEGIERLIYYSSYLLVITPSAKAKLLTQDGQQISVLEWGVQMACCEPTGGLLFCGNNEEIICCDIRKDAQQSTHYKIPTIMFAIDNEKQLINVDRNLNVNIYKLIYE